jgi:maltooligosyltrehalose trehalohydrolase
VRRFLLESARYFVLEVGVDALRLDAVKSIVDMSARPFLEELADDLHRSAAALGRRVGLVAESDANDARLLMPAAGGGMGLDAAWSEDFHHALHAVLTGERGGYYQDYGSVEHLARAYRDGFVYQGEPSRFRGHARGRPLGAIDPRRLVVFAQNHDQVGNRAGGERLASLVPFAALEVAAAALLLSPFAPLLFMGEEYGDAAPFLFFTSHGDAGLAEAVREGRKRDLAPFGFTAAHADPQAEETFARSRLAWEQRAEGRGAALCALYRTLLRLRRELPALAHGGLDAVEAVAFEAERALYLRRWHGGSEVAAVLAFGGEAVTLEVPLPAGAWRVLLGSAGAALVGPATAAMPPHGYLVLTR